MSSQSFLPVPQSTGRYSPYDGLTDAQEVEPAVMRVAWAVDMKVFDRIVFLYMASHADTGSRCFSGDISPLVVATQSTSIRVLQSFRRLERLGLIRIPQAGEWGGGQIWWGPVVVKYQRQEMARYTQDLEARRPVKRRAVA